MLIRLAISVILFVLASILAFLGYRANEFQILFPLGLLFFGISIPILIELFIKYRSLITTVLQTLTTDRVRISFASLVRIKINDDYFLIKSRRFTELFQPVGGVFEYYDHTIENKFNFMEDEYIAGVPRNELRKILLKPLKLGLVITWFYSRKGRETSPHREFIEELLDTQILPAENFSKLNFEYVDTFNTGIVFSEHFKCKELRLFEVYEFKPTTEQVAIFESLAKNKNPNFRIVSKNIIERNGYCHKTKVTIQIGTQTKYIL